MKTMRRAIITVLLIVLVCATFVACNDGNGNNIGNNGDNGDELGYQLAKERKQTADPDPNNKYDLSNGANDYNDPQYKFDGSVMHIMFTNSESLNNLFYDYKITDFDTEKFVSVSESQLSTIQYVRKAVAKNCYKCKDAKTYNRNLRLVLKYPSRENLIRYIAEFREDKGILSAAPELYGEWFKSA